MNYDVMFRTRILDALRYCDQLQWLAQIILFVRRNYEGRTLFNPSRTVTNSCFNNLTKLKATHRIIPLWVLSGSPIMLIVKPRVLSRTAVDDSLDLLSRWHSLLKKLPTIKLSVRGLAAGKRRWMAERTR
jgi:hypothetical protein